MLQANPSPARLEAWAETALADAAPKVLWLDDPARPEPVPRLPGDTSADLVVVGGGYTGLWTALRAKERDTGRDVVVLEAGRCGEQASGRNGGFASASLTHGFPNGLARGPYELAVLDELGARNLADIGEAVRRHGIDCRWEETGELLVATAPHEFEELAGLARGMTAAGRDVELLDEAAVRAEVRSPSYVGGLLDRQGTAMVEPARLDWGLRDACLSLGVRIHERTPVRGMARVGPAMEVRTSTGTVRTGQVALATNAFPPLLRRLRLMTVPVYDYVLATKPLSDEQLASVGWRGRQGIGDHANLFHYYRLTRENRIVWGGYDAVYHYGSRIRSRLEQRATTHRLLAGHFLATFPQLSGVRFTHRWGGVIDTSTRFNAFFGTAYDGRVAYALGYTGLGVAATRFGADVMFDLLAGEETEPTRLRMVRERPLPFPPEPARFGGVQLTRWSLTRADARAGRRNLWLRSWTGWAWASTLEVWKAHGSRARRTGRQQSRRRPRCSGGCSKGDPSVRWQVKQDLLGEPPAAVEAERARVATSGWGRALLRLQDPDGGWAGALYSPKWTSTTYTLLLLQRLGLPPVIYGRWPGRGCCGTPHVLGAGGSTLRRRSGSPRCASPGCW